MKRLFWIPLLALGIAQVPAQENSSNVPTPSEAATPGVPPNAEGPSAASPTSAPAGDEEGGAEDAGVLRSQVESLNESFLETKSTVDALKKIKVTGYIQAQYQYHDSSTRIDTTVQAPAGFSGGDFAPGVQHRLMVRRGRVKVTYDNDLSQYVLQIDVIPRGVTIKDAYILAREPWLRMFTLKGGVFDRPFGYEISYSSSVRESPERSRVFQTLFPQERDLGVELGFFPEMAPLNFLNFKVGLFNGNGPTDEVDDNMDVIGRLGFSLPFPEAYFNVDGGVSAYYGKVTTSDTSVFNMNGSSWERQTVSIGATADRKYYGADLQLYYDIPFLGGLAIKGEYLMGEQPGVDANSQVYAPRTRGTARDTTVRVSAIVDSVTDVNRTIYYAIPGSVRRIHNRNFMGYYVNLVQKIGARNQLVLKYDVYDPNTDMEASDFTNRSTVGDIMYTTYGFGWVYQWDAHITLTAYYDMIMNEEVPAVAAERRSDGTSSPVRAFVNDLNDNVFTLRAQFRF